MSTKVLEDAQMKASALMPDALDAGMLHEIDFYLMAFSDAPDKQGDIIAPYAADAWLSKFYAEGHPLPLSFTHGAIMNPSDPENIVGWAPADPQHVFKDGHGVRVRGFLETEGTDPRHAKARAVYSLAKRGLVRGSSVAYKVDPTMGQERLASGATLIRHIDTVLEGGPCLDAANDDAYVVAVKSAQLGLLDVETKAVDTSAWDGAAAMRTCSSASDFRQIAFERANDSDPDTAAHWALPHHSRPGAGPNARGVAAAVAALNGARGGSPDLKNAGAARSHLAGHQSEIEGARAASNDATDVRFAIPFEQFDGAYVAMKAGRTISRASAAKLRAARAAIDELLSLVDSEDDGSATKANAEELNGANAEEPTGPNAAIRMALDAI